MPGLVPARLRRHGSAPRLPPSSRTIGPCLGFVGAGRAPQREIAQGRAWAKPSLPIEAEPWSSVGDLAGPRLSRRPALQHRLGPSPLCGGSIPRCATHAEESIDPSWGEGRIGMPGIDTGNSKRHPSKRTALGRPQSAAAVGFSESPARSWHRRGADCRCSTPPACPPPFWRRCAGRPWPHIPDRPSAS